MITIAKCNNCKLMPKCYNQNKNCMDYKPIKKENPYLYKTKVEDWNDNHKIIWRLKLLLDPKEWSEIKEYFKYYKNSNLVGWGTTSPNEVTKILTSLNVNNVLEDGESVGVN